MLVIPESHKMRQVFRAQNESEKRKFQLFFISCVHTVLLLLTEQVLLCKFTAS